MAETQSATTGAHEENGGIGNSQTTANQQPGKTSEAPLQPESEHTTHHSIELAGKLWRYDATVGTINIDTAKVKPAASIFYAALTAVDAEGKRDSTLAPIPI